MKNAKLVSYKISDKYILDLGYQEDIDAYKYELTGFKMRDKNNALILNLDYKNNRHPILLQVIDDEHFILDGVGLEITKYYGKLKAQLVEIEIEGLSINEIYEKIMGDEVFDATGCNHSLVFQAKVSGSIPLDGTFGEIPMSLKSQAILLNQLINTIQKKLDDGDFKGEKGDTGEKGNQGLPGIVIPTRGMYSLFVSEEGNLIMVCNSTDEEPALYIDEDGYLIFGEV